MCFAFIPKLSFFNFHVTFSRVAPSMILPGLCHLPIKFDNFVAEFTYTVMTLRLRYGRLGYGRLRLKMRTWFRYENSRQWNVYLHNRKDPKWNFWERKLLLCIFWTHTSLNFRKCKNPIRWFTDSRYWYLLTWMLGWPALSGCAGSSIISTFNGVLLV